MRYFSEDATYINGECENCGKVLRIKRMCVQQTAAGFDFTPPVRCFCGSVHSVINGLVQERRPSSALKSRPAPVQKDEVVCPRCHSACVTANKQGFGLGKAVVGGAIFGLGGLLGGFWNSNKIKVTCLKCGHSWKVN